MQSIYHFTMQIGKASCTTAGGVTFTLEGCCYCRSQGHSIKQCPKLKEKGGSRLRNRDLKRDFVLPNSRTLLPVTMEPLSIDIPFEKQTESITFLSFYPFYPPSTGAQLTSPT